MRSAIKGNLIVGDFEGYIHIIDPLNGKTISRKNYQKNLLNHYLAEVIAYMLSMTHLIYSL